jgi:hypothetical protein
MYIYASEIFPSEVRTQGVAVSFSGESTSFFPYHYALAMQSLIRTT